MKQVVFEGEQFDKATLGEAQEAISLWLDTAREFGDPVPEPKGRRLQYA